MGRGSPGEANHEGILTAGATNSVDQAPRIGRCAPVSYSPLTQPKPSEARPETTLFYRAVVSKPQGSKRRRFKVWRLYKWGGFPEGRAIGS